MKSNYVSGFCFLMLLGLIFFSQMRTAFSIVPGWHTTIYPPDYIIIHCLIGLFLLIVIVGYVFLLRPPINLKVFLLHFLLTLPLIIILLHPFKPLEISSISQIESQHILDQRKLLGYLLFSLFFIGQLIFFVYLIRHFKFKTSVK